MSDLRKLLDDLDAAREKATPGEWAVWWGNRLGTGVDTSSSGGVSVDCYIGEIATEDDRADFDNKPNPGSAKADAALIVAAVNNLGPLVAIVREFWDEHDGRTCHDRTADSHNGVTPCPTRTFIASEFGDVQ